MIANFKLSPNFSFYEYTGTNHTDLLEENRRYGLQQLPRLVLCAWRAELYREILGNLRMTIFNGCRCPALNTRIDGSPISEHMESTAFDWGLSDFQTPGDRLQTFRILESFHEASPIMFGQMIYEKAERAYGIASWQHTSIGAPFRPLRKCGQVLTMEFGHYEKQWTKDFAGFKLG